MSMMKTRFLALALLATSVRAYEESSNLLPDPLSSITTMFHSRRDIRAAVLDVHVYDESSSSQYIFTNPQSPFWQAGPNIYDHRGVLVWAGAADGLTSNAYGFHVCDYDGSIGDHLCLFQGVQMFGRGHGYGLILNDRYQVVKVVQSQGGSDIHEFRTVDFGRSALATLYNIKTYDFSGLLNPQGLREVDESGFIEIDLQDGTTIFEWHSLDHVKPLNAERLVEIENGQAPVYDYFHINSIDKNSNGDYLICARHTSALYKVSGVDGGIMWTLSNGPESNFTISNFVIWGAHHARWVSQNQTHTIITLFNNGDDGESAKVEHSSGIVIVLDHTTRESSMLKEYGDKENMSTDSKGSFQTLPNTNVLLGWGAKPHITEYQADGTLVFHSSVIAGGSIYRAFKSDWIGNPADPPALWTYARTSQSSIALYVSWNGATEVKTWNFYVGSDPNSPSLFVLAGSTNKSGFETNFSIPAYYGWAFAEAIARNGTSLRNSSLVSPWIPGNDLVQECNGWRCPERNSSFLVLYSLLPDLDDLQESLKAKLDPHLGELVMAILIFCGLLSIFVMFGILTVNIHGLTQRRVRWMI